MKKSEVLDIIKGRTIVCKFHAQTPREKGMPYFIGLPEELKEIHPRQVLHWLKSWVEYEEKDNDDLNYYEDMWSNCVDNDDWGYESGEYREWVEFCEFHPTYIFHC